MEGASQIRFKSTQKALERVQSIFDNIVDLLANLEKIDHSNTSGLISNESVEVRSYKNVSLSCLIESRLTN